MQAYEHILAAMLKFAEIPRKDYSKKDALDLLKKYAAYITLPDSVRAAVALSCNGKPFRQPSHFTDGATMEFIIGDSLKRECETGYPLDKISFENIQLKAADGPINLHAFVEKNRGIIKTPEGTYIPEGLAIALHLFQDTSMDFSEIAEYYVENPNRHISVNVNENGISLYGTNVEDGLARFKKTGKECTMGEFRKIVAKCQKLSTLELFSRLKRKYSDITFNEIQDAVFSSYNDFYPECMMNAKKYAVPRDDEQKEILKAIDGNDYSYYVKIISDLLKSGAFNNVTQVGEFIAGSLDKATSKVSDKDEVSDKESSIIQRIIIEIEEKDQSEEKDPNIDR